MENNVDRLINLLQNIINNNNNFHRNIENIVEIQYSYINTSLNMLREERECLIELSNLVLRLNHPQNNTENLRTRTIPQRRTGITFEGRQPFNSVFSNNTSLFSNQGERFQSYLNPQTRIHENRRNLPRTPQTSSRSTNHFMNIFNLLRDNLTRNSQPLALTNEEINNNCTRSLLRDISSNVTNCPIDLAEIHPDEYVLQINYCGHIFRESNLRRVFETNTLCPLCRHNLRINTNNNTNNSNNNNSNNNTNNSNNNNNSNTNNSNSNTNNSNSNSVSGPNVTSIRDSSDNFVSLEASFTFDPSYLSNNNYFL